MKIAAVIPVAGSGQRFSSAKPKQFFLVNGTPLIALTLKTFFSVSTIGQVVVVHAADFKNDSADIIQSLSPLKKDIRLTPGGATRQESVYNGLQCVAADTDIVLVHDGVRPLLSPHLIKRCIEAARQYDACVPALPLPDTIKRVRNNEVIETVPREDLWQVQTPQAFRFGLLLDIHKQARETKYQATDEAALAEWLGIPVHVINGEAANIKITTPEDMDFVRFFLERHQ